MESNKQKIYTILSQISDPEMPFLTITDLSIVRKVDYSNKQISISITPTFMGCPALDVIKDDIKNTLNKHGYKKVKVLVQLDPPWTTDWMSDSAFKKLKENRIAVPCHSHQSIRNISFKNFPQDLNAKVICPTCDSEKTKLISKFGSTPCKSLYKCDDCSNPFDYFKKH